MKTSDFEQKFNSTDINKVELIKTLKTMPMSVKAIAKRFSVPYVVVENAIFRLKEDGIMLECNDGQFFVQEMPIEGAKITLDQSLWKGDFIRFGFTADNHLCSHFERLDVLNLIYDLCADEGIETVLNGGNWIEGEARFNKNEIHTHGLDRQIQYAVDNYPYREGIQTLFVSGDDHEGWYSQREGINIGDYFQNKREQSGKFDLKHLGYVEADIDLNEGKFENDSWLRVMHAGGGSSYATSYAPQKIVESLQGGEKPAVLLIGHYHKLMYAYMRNVHTIQMGCTADQSIFMRKKKIEAHVGGGLIELRRNKFGSLTGCRVEFITAFDKKFYIGKDKYWK